MSRDNNGCSMIGCGVTLFFYVFPPALMSLIEYITDSDFFNYLHVVLFITLLISLFYSFKVYTKNKDLKNELNTTAQLRENIRCVENKLSETNKKLQIQTAICNTLRNCLNSKSPFKDVAVLVRDCMSAVFDKEEHYLRYKSRPAIKSAELVKELKAKYSQMGETYLLMKYRYDFLLKMFPDLIKYIEDDESAIDAMQATSLDKFQEEYDHSIEYLTMQEYRDLSVDDRNQLALDRYKERRRKSSWIAGVEYEMFYGYKLRQEGFNVLNFGAERGLNDLGRDIIATKNGNTYIIQCKRYSIHHEVHENTICQLFGTTLHYKITAKQRQCYYSDPDKIFPVLVTTGILSKTAKEFAEKLGVRVVQIQMGEYPMIKCNINNGNKIYHLPFDQQYWRTVIDKPGEFYAMTVKEATSKGFRRAFKHIFK